MNFEDRIKQADDSIQREYLDLVVNSYRPLFDEISNKAAVHMKENKIKYISLGTHTELKFYSDGRFYRGSLQIDLIGLPEIYQKEADYLAGQADSRGHVTPSIHAAMRTALYNFRDKVRKSLADQI